MPQHPAGPGSSWRSASCECTPEHVLRVNPLRGARTREMLRSLLQMKLRLKLQLKLQMKLQMKLHEGCTKPQLQKTQGNEANETDEANEAGQGQTLRRDKTRRLGLVAMATPKSKNQNPSFIISFYIKNIFHLISNT